MGPEVPGGPVAGLTEVWYTMEAQEARDDVATIRRTKKTKTSRKARPPREGPGRGIGGGPKSAYRPKPHQVMLRLSDRGHSRMKAGVAETGLSPADWSEAKFLDEDPFEVARRLREETDRGVPEMDRAVAGGSGQGVELPDDDSLRVPQR